MRPITALPAAGRLHRLFRPLMTGGPARGRGLPWSIRCALGFLAALLLLAICAPWVAPADPLAMDLGARLRPPPGFGGTFAHPLGTDALGRDLLSRVLYGARVSILIAVAGTAIGAVLGTCAGFLAARFRGLADQLLMMLVDVQAALPSLILALAVIAFLGNDLVLFVILVGLDGWERYARLSRNLVLATGSAGWVRAARMTGITGPRLYLGHVLPNVAGPLVVQATLNFPGTILLETALSFLGLGVQPPATSLGQMLGDGRGLLLNAWWIAVIPGLLILATTMSVCLIGDHLRDRLDPTTGG
ncbi:ABC transporter permease [Tistrella mobilis]|jgi:peptide/nickel transport system permease protein|uniref:ABC transporter permease n=1 Tax=Tistrella mobilis TaxID=171437 RepID=UPI0035570CC0